MSAPRVQIRLVQSYWPSSLGQDAYRAEAHGIRSLARPTAEEAMENWRQQLEARIADARNVLSALEALRTAEPESFIRS